MNVKSWKRKNYKPFRDCMIVKSLFIDKFDFALNYIKTKPSAQSTKRFELYVRKFCKCKQNIFLLVTAKSYEIIYKIILNYLKNIVNRRIFDNKTLNPLFN